jgi:hypothetical protein
MPDDNLSPAEYVRRVLVAYCRTPGTSGQVRRSDRLLASQLQQRGIPMQVVENAFVLGASRRLLRAPDAPPLTLVRSLAYFVPVIEEVLTLKISATYLQYLRAKLQRFYPH